MLRVCPKCGDFYADGSLPFCLTDGTPLVSVAPDSKVWSEGVRVVEEKANALRRHGRKLKWRRVLLSVTTTLVITAVVCVVSINSLIYLRPRPKDGVPTKPLTLATTPTPDRPGDSATPSTEPTAEPTLRPTASPDPSVEPTAVKEIDPRTKDIKSPATPAVTTSPTTTSPTTPLTTSTTSPTTSSVTSPTNSSTIPPRTPTPDLRHTPTPDLRHTPTPTPTPRCSDAGRRCEGEVLIKS